MFIPLPQRKVFRDPIYGYVSVDYQVIADLIDTKEFQRLRRIRQLSGVSIVFHTAEHSRFGHSLGTYELARRILERVTDVKEALSLREQLMLLISALLHDVGHGPYSHSFEHVFECDHEKYSAKLIEGPSEISSVLDRYDVTLGKDIAGIILKEGKYTLIESLVSSQLDVDRLDYLERDAYFTGATYGHVDIDRILRVMTIKDNKVAFKASGVHAIENYLVSRYHMYWQVYYHPSARAYEVILEKIYTRIKDLLKQGYQEGFDLSLFKRLLDDPEDLNAYIEIDDTYVNGAIKQFTTSSDAILSQLCQDFMNRKLFHYVDEKQAKTEAFKALQKTYENDPILKRYFLKEDRVSQTIYVHADYGIHVKNITMVSKDGESIHLEDYSPIVRGLVTNAQKHDCKIFYQDKRK